MVQVRHLWGVITPPALAMLNITLFEERIKLIELPCLRLIELMAGVRGKVRLPSLMRKSPIAHDLRNEVVEELYPDFVGESGLTGVSARLKPSPNRQRRGKTSELERGKARTPGKEARQRHSQQWACPRRGNAEAPKRRLHCRQAEPGSKACWETEQTDRHSASRWGSGIARPPLGKRETVMRQASHERGWAAMVLAAAGPAQASRPSVGGAGVACRHADALYDSNHAREAERSQLRADAGAG